MEFNRHYQHSINVATSILVGMLFVYLSFPIIGFGAAIAIPKSVLLPMMQQSPTLALSLTEALTIGLPLAAFFYLLTLVTRGLFKVVYPVYLVAPFVVFMHCGLYGIVGSDEGTLYSAQIFAKVLPVLACAVCLSKQGIASKENK
jgi:hypothetical protein